jgi:hypothetical protein
MVLIKSIFLSFTIWVLTALLNAVLAVTWLSIFSNEFTCLPAAILVVFIFTLIFSIPGMVIFWIVLLVNRDEELLFRSLLKTGFIVSALSSLMLYILNDDMIGGQKLFLPSCIVIASVASIMIHHPGINSISASKILKNHA